MEKNTLYIVLGTLAGLVAGVIISGQAVNNRNYPMMNIMGMGRGTNHMTQVCTNNQTGMANMHGENMSMSMADMSNVLAFQRDNEFDRAFINLMIDHHQGAIDMAQLVETNTSRQELKRLAEDIIVAQTQEIDQMKSWLELWF